MLTNGGETIQIQFPGHYNTNQGPDFSDAKIKIDKTTWAGTVELHIKTSDWNKHNHQHDKNYNNVILHVVWEDDGQRNSVPLRSAEQRSAVPVLELQSRVSGMMLQRYEELMNSTSFISCENCISSVHTVTWSGWKERLLAERLLRKARVVENFLKQTHYHWEETFWWMLAKNFGARINADAFEAMARSLPVSILAKHKTRIHQLEALLFGQAGLLSDKFSEDYPLLLQKEFLFLKKKYKLRSIQHPVYFLRMRPGNFPTIRLAQLAALINHTEHLFSTTRDAGTLTEITGLFDVTANDYWHYHYRFDESSVFKKKKPGKEMIDNIIINTICPALFAYGVYQGENRYREKAVNWLEQTAAENNVITKGFRQLGMEIQNAFDSQSLIELKNEYCNKKRCLDCSAGNAILKSGT